MGGSRVDLLDLVAGDGVGRGAAGGRCWMVSRHRDGPPCQWPQVTATTQGGRDKLWVLAV